jgi:hypothetical protein
VNRDTVWKLIIFGGLNMHSQNIVDGICFQKEFLKSFLLNKSLLPKFCKQIYFEPFLKHSLVTTVFDLETYILVRVLRIPYIKLAENMVKICQMGLPKLNFETRPKKRIFRYLPKISAGH